MLVRLMRCPCGALCLRMLLRRGLFDIVPGGLAAHACAPAPSPPRPAPAVGMRERLVPERRPAVDVVNELLDEIRKTPRPRRA